jgi:hypothetical protein
MFSENTSFGALVESFVLDAIRDSSPDCLDELVCRLPGVYPSEALHAVERLGRRGILDTLSLARLRRRGRGTPGTLPCLNPLPVPHPLDFDWRFSRSGVDRLVRECLARSDRGRTILLGTPSVFWALRKVERVPALLLDANPEVIGVLGGIGDDAHNALLCDLRHDRLPVEQSAVVVVDPPWYRDHERLFLWAAAKLCRPNGTVLMSVPAEGTRPGVEADRDEALAWAAQLGLDVEAIEPGAIGYDSPPFERNALAAVGLDGMPYEWRHGDLVILRLREPKEMERPKLAGAVDADWPDVTIGSVRVKVRPTNLGDALLDPRLCRLMPGDVLDTVSRRDPRRQNVAMWTSGNRVFASQSPRALLEVVRSLAEGDDPLATVAAMAGRRLTEPEWRNVRSAIAQVSAVVDTERAELVVMGWAA